MALDLSTLTAAQQVAAIYIGYYDRAADPVGSGFWEGAVANPNLSLADIATDFSTQAETQAVHPFFANPSEAEANAFISSLYLNLFNRTPDQAGLDFWSAALVAAVNGDEGALAVGEIILAIIEGAVDGPDGNDRATILNKIEVSNAWTDAAEAAGVDYDTDSGAQTSAKSIIEGVTDEGSTVAAAKSTIDDFFEPEGVEGETLSFTSGTDNLKGTENDDTFEGYLQQNPFAGGVSNGLSSADRADGGAGEDSLYAEMVSEFVGGVSGTENIDVQPRITNVETLEFEARDIAQNAPLNIDVQDLLGDLGFSIDDFDVDLSVPEILVADFLDGWQRDIVVDAKNINGHDFLGSTFSDGDLMIENVTTLDSNGGVRNTSDLTIGMDHTDNANSDGDASDLTVYLDEDYLISGQAQASKTIWFLLDEDAELAGNPNRLFNIDVDGLRVNITDADGNTTEVLLQNDAANVAGTHEGFVNALQVELQAAIAAGDLPAGTRLELDPTITDTTFMDNGQESGLIPAIVLISGDGSLVEATGFTRIEEPIGEYDVYGRLLLEDQQIIDEPVSINIDLFKAGRGGEGGNLVIGGKDQSDAGDGIEVFHVNVKGDGPDAVVDQPSNIGTLTSTNNALREIYISTDAMDAVKDSVASLTIRDGFNELYDGDSSFELESGDLQLVNADKFLGDLTLGSDQQVINLDTLTAQGGGDVSFFAWLNGDEEDQHYNYTTGGGDDTIEVEIDGDAIDFAGSSVNIWTGAGNDDVFIDFDPGTEDPNNTRLNTWILDNVLVETGDGDDVVEVHDTGIANINAGDGNDVVYTDGDADGDLAEWSFNFDAERIDDIGFTADDDLPGEALSLAFIGGATITVTLSGAGVDMDITAGGGVMSFDNDDPEGAIAGEDGYESSVTISSLINGNRYYGDQRDINEAVMKAINDDPVLNKLLVASISSNNTLIVDSLTAGDFEDTDLRIDISQATYSDAVRDEARSVFSDSSIVADPGADLSTSAAADAWYDGLSNKADDENSTDSGVGEGESNLSDDGSQVNGEMDNIINGGNDDDVIVMNVDSTLRPRLEDFTVSPDNATLNGASNQTIEMTGPNFGNDTVMNFLTSIPEVDTNTVDQEIGTVSNETDGTDSVPIPAEFEVFVVDVNAVAESGVAYDVAFDGDTVTVPASANTAGVTAALAAGPWTNWAAVDNMDGTVTFTALVAGAIDPDVASGDFNAPDFFEDNVVVTTTTQGSDAGNTIPGPATFDITFDDEDAGDVSTDNEIDILGVTITVGDGDSAEDIAATVAGTDFSGPGWTVVDNGDGSVTFTSIATGSGILPPAVPTTDMDIAGVVTDVDLQAGLDFLDFTYYLTSQEDISAGGGDTADSNNLIPVTLDYNETDSLGGTGDGSADVDVEANEVAVVRLATDGAEGETFAALSASVVAALFNGTVDDDDEWGGLAEAEFGVELYNKADQEELIGDAKAIFMVENDTNLGEYKVFELTWSGDETSASGASVSAVALGSLDFGDSLYGLDDVNLVGSDDHADMLANGLSPIGLL